MRKLFYVALLCIIASCDNIQQRLEEVDKISYKADSCLLHGDHDRAIDLYQQALAGYQDIVESNHPKVAETYQSIGFCYYVNYKHNEALEYYLKALTIYEKIKDPEAALLYTTIGNLCFDRNDDKSALDYFQKALSYWESIYKTASPDIAKACYNIGRVYQYRDEYDTATEYYQKASDNLTAFYGPEHPDAKTIQERIANMKTEKEQSAEQ